MKDFAVSLENEIVFLIAYSIVLLSSPVSNASFKTCDFVTKGNVGTNASTFEIIVSSIYRTTFILVCEDIENSTENSVCRI
jgi:hypothetical protein